LTELVTSCIRKLRCVAICYSTCVMPISRCSSYIRSSAILRLFSSSIISSIACRLSTKLLSSYCLSLSICLTVSSKER
jgi:hypothetical protein